MPDCAEHIKRFERGNYIVTKLMRPRYRGIDLYLIGRKPMKFAPDMMKELNKSVDGIVKKNKLAISNAKDITNLRKNMSEARVALAGLERSMKIALDHGKETLSLNRKVYEVNAKLTKMKLGLGKALHSVGDQAKENGREISHLVREVEQKTNVIGELQKDVRRLERGVERMKVQVDAAQKYIKNADKMTR